MSEIGTHGFQHTEALPPHGGSYYEDSDVATHFTSALCYRQTDMGVASHSTTPDLASAPSRWVSPHSEMRRCSRRQIAAPSAWRQGPRAYQRQRYASDKSKEAVQRGEERQEGGGNRGVVEGRKQRRKSGRVGKARDRWGRFWGWK